MRGLFCKTDARTNEEFREVVKSKMRMYVLMGVIGTFTFAAGFTVYYLTDIKIDDHILGVITGIGVGLAAAAAVLWFKHRRLLSDEEKLKNARLELSDERMQEIAARAFRMAALVMFIAVYAVCLIGGLFYPILFKALVAVVGAFIAAYLISYAVYQKKL